MKLDSLLREEAIHQSIDMDQLENEAIEEIIDSALSKRKAEEEKK
jgi:hypothetical protein